MVTYRVHGYWLGPIITVWTTESKENFDKYCIEQGFTKRDDGIYRSSDGKARLEIK